MKRPTKEKFEYYQDGLVFKTTRLIDYSNAQDKYIDYLESKNMESSSDVMDCTTCKYKNIHKYTAPCYSCIYSGKYKHYESGIAL